MREQINWILSTWNNYWGTGIYQYMLLISILYLLIRRRSQKSARQVVPYVLLFLVLFFFPVSAAIIQKCIGAEVYWRVLWLLPVSPAIALAAVELVSAPVTRILHLSGSKNSAFLNKIKKPVLIIGLVLITGITAVLCTKGMLQSGNYVKVHNYQKVPEEVAHICNLINEHAQGEPVKLASDEHIISYVRVFDASIQMPYGRRGDGASGEAAHELYDHMYFNTFDYERIAELALETGCNFIAVVLVSNSAPEILSGYGYQQIGTVNSYGVFRLTE